MKEVAPIGQEAIDVLNNIFKDNTYFQGSGNYRNIQGSSEDRTVYYVDNGGTQSLQIKLVSIAFLIVNYFY